ncbi:MAG: hypothetical protein IJS15_09820 [Victivallales bacterium]|nr:hypothetical protein [Victivallales bacterium]
MSWNRGESKNQRGSRRGSRGVPFVLLVAFVPFAIICGVAVWWWASNRGETAAPKPKAPRGVGVIAEAKPAPAPRAAESTPRQAAHVPTKEERNAEFIRRCEERFGTNMPPGLKAHIYYLKHPPKKIFSADDKYSYVKHHSEKQLASFLTVTPGTYFIQCPEFDESFDTDFIAAMREGIEIDPKDSYEIKEMKKAIADFKNEIAEVCRAEGKLPSQILNDHAMSLFELGKFQQNMQSHLDEIYNSPKYTDADVKDFCTAANMMLKDHGLEPLPYPDLTERTLELQYNLRHAEGEGTDNE